jgi:hypothetical protein
MQLGFAIDQLNSRPDEKLMNTSVRALTTHTLHTEGVQFRQEQLRQNPSPVSTSRPALDLNHPLVLLLARVQHGNQGAGVDQQVAQPNLSS